MQASRQREALCRQANGRLEERGPWQCAVLLICHVEHLEDARHAYRMSTNDRVSECQRRALRVKDARRGGRCWGCLPAIERHDLCPVIEQEQCPATNTRGL